MSKPLQRLVMLRERQKAAAVGELQRSRQARAIEQACIDAPLSAQGTAQLAGDLVAGQDRRETSYARVQQWDVRIEQDRAALGQAKQALRQVELLLEGRRQHQQAKQTRREVGEQEDWGRAKAHQEETP